MRSFSLAPGLAVAAALTWSLLAGSALAAQRAAVRATPLPMAGFVEVGETTSTPWGWLDFCNRYEKECRGGLSRPVDIALDARSWRLIREINSAVNTMIEPLSDMDHWGVVDRWDLPYDGYGDCEDYVLLKRKLLVSAGLPRQALLVTIVKDEKGEGHAVLTAKTDHGEFILDNMREKVRPWSELPYQFVKRQSQSDPNAWVRIGEPTTAPLIVSR